MATGSHHNEAYSNLEVVSHNPSDKFTYTGNNYSTLESATSPHPPPAYPEKHAFVASNGYDDGLQSAIDDRGNLPEPGPKPGPQSVPKSKSKKKWIIGGIVVGVVVVAAVVGGVCGTLLSKKSSNGSGNSASRYGTLSSLGLKY